MEEDVKAVRSWTVIGLYERGKYNHDTFVAYVGGEDMTAPEAKEWAERDRDEKEIDDFFRALWRAWGRHLQPDETT